MANNSEAAEPADAAAVDEDEDGQAAEQLEQALKIPGHHQLSLLLESFLCNDHA